MKMHLSFLITNQTRKHFLLLKSNNMVIALSSVISLHLKLKLKLHPTHFHIILIRIWPGTATSYICIPHISQWCGSPRGCPDGCRCIHCDVPVLPSADCSENIPNILTCTFTWICITINLSWHGINFSVFYFSGKLGFLYFHLFNCAMTLTPKDYNTHQFLFRAE